MEKVALGQKLATLRFLIYAQRNNIYVDFMSLEKFQAYNAQGSEPYADAANKFLR